MFEITKKKTSDTQYFSEKSTQLPHPKMGLLLKCQNTSYKTQIYDFWNFRLANDRPFGFHSFQPQGFKQNVRVYNSMM